MTLKLCLLGCALVAAAVAAAGCLAKNPSAESDAPLYVKVLPPSPELRPNGIQQFHALGVTASGYEVVLDDVTWYAAEGRMESGGRYTAPSGPTVAVVTAAAGTARGQTTVKVRKENDPARLEIYLPDSPVAAGMKTVCHARVVESGGGYREVSPRWDAGVGSIDTDGLYQAPYRAGVDVVTAETEGLLVAKDVTITPAAAIVLWVRPSNPVIRYDGGIQFSAYGVDTYGNTFPVGATFQADSGLIDTEGAYKPDPATTTAIVTARSGNVIGRTTVTVTR